MLNNKKKQKKNRMPVAFEPLAHLQKRLLKKDLKLSLEPNKTNRTIKAKINVTLNKYNFSGSSAFKSQRCRVRLA